MGELTPFTWPECHRHLLSSGKARSSASGAILIMPKISPLLSEVTYNLETILWPAMQALEETTMVAFLASSDAQYITGVTLNVDGGQNA